MTDPRIHLLLATPVAGGVVTNQYLHSVLEITQRCAELGWGIKVVTQPDGLVTRSRNAFASVVADDATYTHLLMIDADVTLSPDAVERLVRSGHEVCGAVVPLREAKWDRVRAHLDAHPDMTAEEMASIAHGHAVWFEKAGGARTPTNGFLPVQAIGSAVLLISRDALVRMSQSALVARYEHGGHRVDLKESGWTFFDPFVDEAGVYLSEDYAFCHRWRALGGQVWADLRSETRHIGPLAVEGDIATTLATASRTAALRRERDSSDSGAPHEPSN